MTTKITNEKDHQALTQRRLMLAKQLYHHGLQHSHEPGELNKMIAVHSLHNAIETTLRAIILEHEIRPEKQMNIDFESMLSEIDMHFKTEGKKLPYRQELRNLNQTRNLVQHHVHEPASSSMEEWRVFSSRFLKKTFSEYFNQDFDTLSNISSVADPTLKKLIQLSFDSLERKKIEISISASAVAFALLAERISNVFSNQKTDPSDFHDKFVLTSSFDNDMDYNVREAIEKTIDETYSRIYRAEGLAVLLSSGLSIHDYRRFNQMPFHVEIGHEGYPRIHIQSDRLDGRDARWLGDLTLEFCLKLQYGGLLRGIPKNHFSSIDKFIERLLSNEIE